MPERVLRILQKSRLREFLTGLGVPIAAPVRLEGGEVDFRVQDALPDGGEIRLSPGADALALPAFARAQGGAAGRALCAGDLRRSIVRCHGVSLSAKILLSRAGRRRLLGRRIGDPDGRPGLQSSGTALLLRLLRCRPGTRAGV